MQTELDGHASDTARTSGPPQPDRCLSLVVHAPWGHFRRVDGNTIKATYRLPPRTTVAGLLAAIAGYERDGYYDVFDRARSGIAIQPVTVQRDEAAFDEETVTVVERPGGRVGVEPAGVPRTMNLPENSLTTSDEGMKAVNARGKVSVRYPDPSVDRQRANYEVLVEPAYRLDVWLSDDDAYDLLRDHLESGTSAYTPSLGLSEHLASVLWLGESTVEPVAETEVAVDSAVPNPDSVRPVKGNPHGVERSPGDMTRTGGDGEFTGRRTTEFLRWAYSRDGSRLRASNVDAHRVEGRVVVFS